MKTKSVCAGLVMLAIAGCAAPNKATQVKNALATAGTTDGKPWFGEIDGELRPVADREKAWTQQTQQAMSYKGLVDGRLCFLVMDSRQFFRNSDTLADELEEWKVAFRKATYVFETYDSLEALERAGAWPDPALNHVNDVRLADYELTKSKCQVSSNTGDCEYTESLAVTMELCGKAPPFGPATQFLTAIKHRDGSFNAYVWKVAPNPARGAAPVAPAVGEPAVDGAQLEDGPASHDTSE